MTASGHARPALVSIVYITYIGLVVAGCGRGETPVAPTVAGLPYRYYLVGPAGAGDLKPGFGIAALDERDQDGERAVRTRSGRTVALGRLEAAAPARALGVDISDGRLAVAWVIDALAPVYARPDGGAAPIGWRHRLDRLDAAGPAPPGWWHARDGYVRTSALRVPTLAARPAEVTAGERFVDIDTATQTLAVYEGDTPRFVTLVSTGNAAGGRRFATPRGLFRVSYKVPSATMDNFDEREGPAYSFEEVPWVQYFHRGIALHAAYWHQRFGYAVSHGCVNLTPGDAERVYALTRAGSPSLPGTPVRVR